jgi:hypothetical protein
VKELEEENKRLQTIVGKVSEMQLKDIQFIISDDVTEKQ